MLPLALFTVSLALSAALLVYGTLRPRPVALRLLVLKSRVQRCSLATLRVLWRPTRMLLAVPPPRDQLGRADQGRRRCPACGAPVADASPHLRYRGRAYHAQPCVERHPPAEQLLATPKDTPR